ncbi:hypothetical protein lerEdw1_006849 [Lerista edwardsae]|nr:hypothetical protein lerEdw1_006849 [Lerista edwardsae]
MKPRQRWHPLSWCSLFLPLLLAGAEQYTFDVGVWPQNPVVEHGGSLWLNCSTSCQEADARGDLETSLIKERRDNGTSWAAFQLVNITEWAPAPECSFSCFGVHKSVHANITVYRIPKQVVLDLVPVLEVGTAYTLICRIPDVAPIQNLTVTLSKGKEILHMKTFQNHAAPEASDVVVNHTIIAQQSDHREKVACHSALDLRPEGQLSEKTSASQLLNIFAFPTDPQLQALHSVEADANMAVQCDVAGVYPAEEAQFDLTFARESLNFSISVLGDRVTAQAQVSPSSAGEHELNCTVSLGPVIKSTVETVQVYSFPEPSLEIHPSQTLENYPVTILCDTPATQLPNVSLQIKSASGRTLASGNQRPLQLTRIAQKEDDRKEFVCEAELVIGGDTIIKNTSTSLAVFYVPEMDEFTCPSNRTWVEGTQQTLHCTAKGNPKPSVACTKDSITHPVEKEDWVNQSHAGIYNCTATNDLGSSTKTILILHLADVPEMDDFSCPHNWTWTVGSEQTFTCFAMGNPAPTVKCSKDGIILSPGVLQHVAREHAGIYHCTATNVHGSGTRDLSIQVEYKPEMDESSCPSNWTLVEGTLPAFHCKAVGVPPPEVVCTKDGNVYNLSQGQEIPVHNGTFWCNATNLHGSVAKPITITVETKPQLDESNCPSNQTWLEGTWQSLACRASGTPTPFVLCTKEGAAVDVHREQNVSRNDSGVYQCKATNSHGTQRWTVAVQVEYRPVISLLAVSASLPIRRGENVTITCHADGSPAVSYTWRAPQASNINYAKNNSTVTITGASGQNSGVYECTASNKHGQHLSQMEIQVEARESRNAALEMWADIAEVNKFKISRICLLHSYTLITPNVLRVETEEKIVIEAHGLRSPTDVTVTVYGSLPMRTTLYQILAKDIKKDSKQNQYVTIRAQSSRFQLEKVVLVSVHSGYIFIQTDKTIYTPGSAVRYRIFTVGHSLEPLTKPVIIEVEETKPEVVSATTLMLQDAKRKNGRNSVAEVHTPEGTVVSQNIVVSSANIHPYNLPEIVSEGTWKIVAKYQDSPQQTFAAQFDVKKYVLPSFEVIVESSEKFFYIDDNRDFRVSIAARFLYGKKVEGVAFVLFGVKKDKEKTSIPDSLRRILIEEGEGEAFLTKAMLQTRFQNLTELVGYSLYVSVTVMTESGSDMVVTERAGIGIVTSPYEIHFTKTSKYFKPGMPYVLMTYVSNPDGSPAHNVPVTAEVQGSTGKDTATTQRDGTARMTLNMPSSKQPQSIIVKTNHEMLPMERQAKKTVVTTAYETQGGSGNFLHMAITATEIKAGDRLRINFITNNQRIQSQYFTYIIMSKGKILQAGRQPREAGQTLVTMSLPVTPDLIPSFRIVGYYQVGNNEIVADSVWVDVKDTCMGTLVVKGETEADNLSHEPGTSMKIKLEGDANAWVGLVAVDKGVFVLNKKNKFTQTKIWDTVEKNDIGCTAGSGRNNLGVFADAGLALQTSNQISTTTRSDPKCPQPARRKRRSMQLIESKASKVAQYEDRMLKKCCEDGMYENPMGYSCEKRAQYILDENSCKDAFLECCRFIKSIRDEKQREEHLILARSKISSKTVSLFLKDSITTWEVLAVSISDTKGICVADPYEIIVTKDFFIDLRLPYSVVRNEQVEIRAILYNYKRMDIRVRVELIHNPAFCSASTAKQRYRQELTVKGQSSRAVPLVIIPLELGLHDIEVKANVRGHFVGDGVRKKLKVVPEGMLIYLTKNIDLNPVARGTDGVQQETISANDLEDMVPNTEPEIKIHTFEFFSWPGNPVAQLTEYSVDGSKLSRLLIIPSGCVEQNLMSMTPSVIATYYLDRTGQWEKIGVERRAEAIGLVMKGYTQQLAYKKPDHSYPPYRQSISGTWITAYIAKVYAMASRVANIDSRNICGSVKWLGGYQYGEPKVSLTAFVLITLLESRDICRGQIYSLENSISRATGYLSRKYDSLKNIYSVALTAYALVLAGRLNDDRKLMSASIDGIRWEDPNYLSVSLESTSYALLALLKMKKFDNVDSIGKWLTTQKNYGGTYGDTQSTIMTFQALAQYQIDSASFTGKHLDVSILLPQRSTPVVFRFEDENSLVARSAETKWNEEFTVKATGRGEGTMTITTVYNAKMKKEAAPCRNFDLQVSVEPVQLGNREAKGALGAVKIKICTRYIGDIDATMTIIDVSMLTGFSPDIEDLKRLSEGVDRFISKFEIDNVKSERGNLILYLNKVSHTEDECLHFKVYKYFEVGLIQPASVKVYSYYGLEDQCTKFYHPSKSSGLLNKICQGDTCRCAEENCLINKEKTPVNLQTRIEETCLPGVDYAYKTRLIRIEEENSYDNYIMEVLEILKAGSDRSAQAKPRKFISHMKCKESLQLEENKDYLIWGPATDIWTTKSDANYIIGEDTWIEKWPNEEECQEEDMQELCNEFVEFSNFLIMLGCQH